MRIINQSLLIDFWQKHPDAEDALKSWFYEVKAQTWQKREDAQKTFSNLKLLENEGISFEIVANRYYLTAIFKASHQLLFIESIFRLPKRDLLCVSKNNEENMHIKPIYTEQDLQVAIDRLNDLFLAPEGTPQYDEFVVLSELIMSFQDSTKQIDFPDPIEAIRYHMWFKDQNEERLAEILGSQANAQNILERKRKTDCPCYLETL